MKYICSLLFYILFITNCASQDTCQNVIKKIDTTKQNGVTLVFTMKGDKTLHFPLADAGQYNPDQRKTMTQQEKYSIYYTITRTFDDKRFDELVNAEVEMLIYIWTDSYGQIVKTKYETTDKAMITNCDILILDKELRQLSIKIPPAYESHKYFMHKYSYSF